MEAEKQEVTNTLKNVHDTTTMINKFVKLLEKHEADNIDNYLTIFKEFYGEYHYYNKVKESILKEMEILGMDSEHAADIL